MTDSPLAYILALTLLGLGACEPPVGGTVAAVVDGPIDIGGAQDLSGGGVRGVTSLYAADIDGDGLIDVGVFEGGKHADGRVTFAWFESPDDPATGTWIRHDFNRPSPMRNFIGAARFGDVDADGDPDLIIAMDYHSGDTKSAYLYYLQNPRPGGSVTGDWTVYSIRRDFPVHHINDMDLEDMDGDGRLDVVVRSLEPNQLQIYFQNAADDWTLKVIDSARFGAQGEGFFLGDIDRARNLDISICGFFLAAPSDPRTQDYTVHTIDAEYMTINANTKEGIGDIDGDGRMDVVISPAEGYRGGANHVLAWYRAPVDPTAGPWERTVLASDYNGGSTVRLADMDSDGDLDVVSGIAWSMWGQTKSIIIYFNRGDGRFETQQTVVTGKGMYSGVVVDLGADGDMDIVGQSGYAGTNAPYIYVSREGTLPGVVDGGSVSPDGGATGTDGGGPVESDAGPDTGGRPTGDGGAATDGGAESVSGGCGCSANGSGAGAAHLLGLICFLLALRRTKRE